MLWVVGAGKCCEEKKFYKQKIKEEKSCKIHEMKISTYSPVLEQAKCKT